jgi:2',3'-cyclic-nucleotide 2'-phosphodiesterase (5'-nucleotidase family)
LCRNIQRRFDLWTRSDRNNRVYSIAYQYTGYITIGDILEILPFEDPIIVLELDGAILWDAMESALAKWPAQEG